MKNTLSIMLALLLVMAWAMPAYSMRCTNGLITNGSNKIEVLDACGKPMEKYGEEVKIGETGLNTGDEEKWVYDIGGGVYHIIYFNGFNVRKIEIQQK